MNKRQQDRFPRLAIVGPPDRKPRQVPAGSPWWGPQRSQNLSLKQAAQMPCQAVRMAVMPTLSRNVWFAALAWLWNFLRSYFVTKRRRGAAVLSFRRPVGLSPSFRRAMGEENFANKKPNGNVGWHSECQVAPQEGGRR
jgi:hypothetical protein